MAKQELEQEISDMGLTVKSVFVPWSKSRNAKANPKISDYSLNWRITLMRGEREIVTTDYGAGIAHCEGYKPNDRSVLHAESIIQQCETGKKHWRGSNSDRLFPTGLIVEPNAIDVIYSLVTDSDVLNYSTFEDWASEFGYDPDSRKGEAMYRVCLEIALKLQNGIGAANLEKLREASQDY